MATTTKYKPYPKMKPSGIDWLGDIPAEWEVKRLKYGFYFTKGKNAAEYTAEYNAEHAGDFPVYSGQTESEGIMGMIDSYDYDFEKVIFTTTVGAKVMTPMLLRGKFSLSQNCLLMIKYSAEVLPEYFYYQLFPLFEREKNLVPSHMQPSLRFSDLSTYDVAYPSLKEQQSIADFLDRKTAKIDDVVVKKQKMMELLKEKRQTLITHAVTKGLDPKAKMKPSGINWLGDIPEGWEVRRLKYVAKSNTSSLAENTAPDYLFKYLDIGNVGTGFILEDPIEMYFENAPSRARRIVKKNDTIISTVRTYLKAIYHFENNPEDLIVSTGFAVIEVGKKINPNFFYYLSISENFIDAIVSNSYGVSYPAINESFLMTLPVWYPKTEEQKEIVAFLDRETGKIDEIIKKVEAQIEKLQEYRQALISNVVTGKIKI